MKQLSEIAPDKPFFVYYVPGGTHAPHHPTPEWIKKISAMHLFDDGWDKSSGLFRRMRSSHHGRTTWRIGIRSIGPKRSFSSVNSTCTAPTSRTPTMRLAE
jgi:hypothetical protein